MTPTLLLPAALAALAALVVPLLIHLARRTEQRPTDFAALRWLRERPRPRHRPRLDEWPLLLARLLLLALLALWLARPAVFGAGDTRPVVAVVPGVAKPILAEGTRGLWLSPGFPELAGPAPAPGPMVSLLRQLDAELPPGTPLRVVVPAVLQGVDAQRPRLSRAITWQVAPGAMPAPAAARAAASFAVRSDSRYLVAAARALGQGDVGPASAPIRPGTRALVWTAPGPLPATARAVLERDGTVLTIADTPAGAIGPATGPLIETVASPRGRLLRFTRPLVPATMPELLDPGFPRRLAAAFAEPLPPARVAARNFAPDTGASPYPQPAVDLRPWLAIAIALLFLLERLLATRRRGPTP